MDPMLQRHCAKYIYIVPHGLRELMSDISREVIRAQPEDMYTFIADYLDAMMITRENARVAIKLIDSISEIAETIVDLLTRTGMTREAADEIVKVIQRYFREYLERKKMLEHPEEFGEGYDEVESFTQKILQEINVDYDKLVEVTIIIQNAYRKFRERREREKLALFGMIDWRIAAAATIRLYRRTGVTRYEADRAATLIKAAYKGYYTRRIMKRLLNMALDDQTTVDTSMETDTLPALQIEEIRSGSSQHTEVEILGESLPTEAIFEADEQEVEVRGEQTEISEYQMTMDGDQIQPLEEDLMNEELGYYDELPGEVLIELKTETPAPTEGVEVLPSPSTPVPAEGVEVLPPVENVEDEASTIPDTTITDTVAPTEETEEA